MNFPTASSLGPRATIGAIVAALVLVAGGAFALTRLGGDDPEATSADSSTTTTSADGTGDPDGTDTTSDNGGTGTTGTDTTSDPDDPSPTPADGPRFGVDTDRVAADTNDPFLNVRQGPGTDHDITAKLPPTYRGLRWTGDQETLDDGSVWYRVALLDPVTVTLPEPLHGGTPHGWVNSVLLIPLPDELPVTTDQVEPCAGTFEELDQGSGSHRADHVYALESHYLSPTCLRVVLTFGTGPRPFSWDDVATSVAPADTLPPAHVAQSGGLGAIVDLGGLTDVWPGATDTIEGAYVVRQPDNTLQLLVPTANRNATLTGVPELGLIVVDVEIDANAEALPDDAGVVLTRQPLVGAGSIDVTGIARPFETELGVRIEDGNGDPIEAVYSGSRWLGTARTSHYSVQTTDWTEAWGQFAVRAEGLPTGNYTLVLDAQGGADAPDTMRLPFTITTERPAPPLATTEEQAIALALLRFARDQGPIGDVALADEVVIGLGLDEARTVSAADLADRDAWVSDAQEFDGFEGPFSALDTLARSRPVSITAGPIPHCAGAPYDWPPAFDGLRQINIRPIGIDSCLQWYAVSLFLNEENLVEGVVLDLYGP